MLTYSKKNPNASNSQLYDKEFALKKKYPVRKSSDVWGNDRIKGTGFVHKDYFGGETFKKPTQPIVYKKPTAKVESKVAKVENKVIKADTIQTKPRVKKAGERIVADNRSGNGYPKCR